MGTVIQLNLFIICIILMPAVYADSDNPSNKIDTSQIDASAEVPAWIYPRARQLGPYQTVIHAPQIVEWDKFKQFKVLQVVEVSDPDRDKPILANLSLSGNTSVDLDQRIVTMTDIQVDRITFVNQGTPGIEKQLRATAQIEKLEMPVDIFLYWLATGAVDLPAAEGLSESPPIIKVVNSPTLLLFVNGDPVKQTIEKSRLELVINANWPVIFDASSRLYYLLNKGFWLQATELAGPWSAAQNLPSATKDISATGEFADIRAAYPLRASSANIPAVFFSSNPAELIVVDGPPSFETIPETDGLQFVNNTQSPLFRLDETYYFLTSGRWFKSPELFTWQLATELPDQFSLIPDNHGMSYVRASVAGTIESKLAILEVMLPEEKTLAKDHALKVDAQFDGDPEFRAVRQTGVSRAVNTPLSIMEYQNNFYLCYEGAWYQADSPIGPWAPAFRVPDAIYDIPANSPAYPVTQVSVASSTPTTVTYNYTQGYSSGIYISYGVPVYGTGWYYPPYRGLFYYSLFMSYGHGNFYNPNTGRYTTRSVWQGPYGGHSYNQFSNPNTGRYGHVETAWDGDEWASYGESYNPRTRVYSETERYYNDDSERFEMERETYRDDKSMVTERKVDLDDGWSETTRQTSDGGSSTVTRQRQEDGSISRQGNVTASDGRTAQISGSSIDGQGTTTITGSEGGAGTVERSRDASGVSREGSFTNSAGETFNSSTERDGYKSKSTLSSSTGGEAISFSEGGSRATVAMDSEGDLYASRDGNVYKKGEGGWNEYDGSSNQWKQTGAQSAAAEQGTNQQRTNQQKEQRERASTSSREDFSARRRR